MRGVDILGSKVTALRMSRGLTQENLAVVSGLNVKTIRKAEQGKRLDLKTLSQLAAALKTNPTSLLVANGSANSVQKQWRDRVVQWLYWFDDEDIELILSLYHDDAVLRLPGGGSVPFGGTFRGKEEIRQANLAAWSSARHQKMRLEEITFFVNETGVVIKGDRSVIMPSGELVTFSCLQAFTFQEQLIIDHHVEFDTLEYAKRIQQ